MSLHDHDFTCTSSTRSVRRPSRLGPVFPLFLAAGALLLLFPACRRAEPIRPAPVEDRLDAGAEGRMEREREAFFEAMHRHAPGVDWRAVEQANGLAAMEWRREIVLGLRAQAGAAEWRELGSRNQAGRMHAAAWSSDGQILYAGSSRGGVWKSDRDGNSWTPLGDNLFGGAFEVAVVPGEPGDPDILIRLAGSMIHRTLDEGLTWEAPQGLGSVSDSKRILVLQDGVHTVFLLVKRFGSWEVLVSTDRGASFTHSLTLANNGDIWTPKTYAGPVYAVSGDRIRMTSDGGASWGTYGHALPVAGEASVLAANETPELRFNVAILDSGAWKLYRSVDGGATWTKIKNLTDFWESLAASTQDGNLVAYAGVEMFFTRNGGDTWKKVNSWGAYYGHPEIYLHADIPGLFVLPDPDIPAGEVWYVATDGGLYDSDDQVHSMRNLSLQGLGVSQYYSVLTSRRNPDLVLAGSQDQGYQRAVLQGPPPPPPGPWADFDQLISGDYGHLTSSNGAHDLVYSVYPGFVLVQEGEDNPVLYTVDFPSGENHLWMPYIQADPLDPESFFFCAQHLYRYTRVAGNTWNHVQYSAQDFGPGYLTAVAFSPVDPNRAYAATNNGRLFYSDDRGVTWTQGWSQGPGAHYFYGTALLPSSKDKDVCWVAGSGYSHPPVSRTTDGGKNWQAASEGLPSTLVYCLSEAPDQSGAIFCGSENGAWRFDPSTETWEDILGAEAPINTYWTCEAVPSQNLVRFGTYGRGIWDYHLNSPGYFPYGELLGGANVLELSSDAPPLAGKPTTLVVKDGLPNAGGAVVLSLQKAELPVLGGTLLVNPQGMVLFPVSTGGDGTATLTFTLPGNPGLAGMEIYFQAGLEDGGQPQGVALSNGLRGVIGS